MRVLTDLIERQPELVERTILSGRAFSDGSRPTEVQLTSRSAGSRRADGARAELARERARRARGCGSRPRPPRAGLAQRPDGRAGAAAGAEHSARMPPGSTPSASSRPGASVFSASDRAVRART